MNNLTCYCYNYKCIVDCNNNNWSCNNNNICERNDFEYSFFNMFLLLGVFLISILSSIAGIGGGALLISFFNILGNFKIYYSIPLCVISIAGNSLCRMIYLINRKHYLNKYRFLINYTILLIFLPFDSAFSIFGYILNIISSTFLTNLLMVILLGLVSFKTFKKGFNQCKKEKEKLLINGLSFDIVRKKNIEIDGIIIEIDTDEYSNKILNMIGEYKYLPYFYNLFFIVMCLLTYNFVRIKNGYSICDYNFIFYSAIHVLCFLLIGIFTLIYICRIQKYRDSINFFYLPNEIRWKCKNIIIFVIFSSFVSIISTFLGIGGGMIFVPLMLLYGIPPEIASSTNSISTFFSSITSSLQYLGTNSILPIYSILFFIISFIGSFIGLNIFNYIILVHNKNSYLIFLLSFIIFISFILMIINLINLEKNNKLNIC